MIFSPVVNIADHLLQDLAQGLPQPRLQGGGEVPPGRVALLRALAIAVVMTWALSLQIGGVTFMALRQGMAGESGYELHGPIEHAPAYTFACGR